MERTKKTGSTCVGDLRLSAIDVGHDLRTTNTPVKLPEDFESVGLDILDETYLVAGTRDEMIQAILEAGYKIGPDYCSQNNGDCHLCSIVNYGRDCMNQPII